MKNKIKLTAAEIQSGQNRQKWAEDLILNLPSEHGGRNSWLLNYGTQKEAIALREKRRLKFSKKFQACETKCISN